MSYAKCLTKLCVATLVLAAGIVCFIIDSEGARGDDVSASKYDIDEFLPAELRGVSQPDLPADENGRDDLLAMSLSRNF